MYRLPPVVSASFALFLLGFRWATRWGGSNHETRSEESSAPVVAGCLLLSRIVFEQLGDLAVDPESTVDTAAVEAHLRCMTSRACGVNRALFRAAPTQRLIVRSPRSRGLTGTGRCGAEGSSAPGDRSTGLRATETARWCRFGTTVSKSAGHKVPDRVRDRDEVTAGHRCRTMSGTSRTRIRGPRGGAPGAQPQHLRSSHGAAESTAPCARPGRSHWCRARRGTMLGEAPVTQSTPQLKLK
jgi:hypothetical protein